MIWIFQTTTEEENMLEQTDKQVLDRLGALEAEGLSVSLHDGSLFCVDKQGYLEDYDVRTKFRKSVGKICRVIKDREVAK